MDFCMYENINEKYFHLFDCYWEKYISHLPPLPTLLHNQKEGRATVFNCWIRYTRFDQLLILKYEKAITHSFPDYLSTWMKNRIPDDVRLLIKQQQHDIEYLFFFTYNLMNTMLIDMERFLSMNEHLKNHLRAGDYYASSEHTLPSDDPVFKLIKAFIVNYVNIELTTDKCAAIFYRAVHDTAEQLKKIIK